MASWERGFDSTHICVLAPGYGGRIANLVSERQQRAAGRALRRLSGVHPELARERLAELRRQQARVCVLAGRIEQLMAGHPLLRLPGGDIDWRRTI